MDCIYIWHICTRLLTEFVQLFICSIGFLSLALFYRWKLLVFRKGIRASLLKKMLLQNSRRLSALPDCRIRFSYTEISQQYLIEGCKSTWTCWFSGHPARFSESYTFGVVILYSGIDSVMCLFVSSYYTCFVCYFTSEILNAVIDIGDSHPFTFLWTRETKPTWFSVFSIL